VGTITVIQPGMLTTIQDLGRWGFGKIGMPVAGVMDDYAARVGNILLGNDENAPVLEITLIGPVISFQDETCLVITGGNLQPCLNNYPIKMWTIYQAKPGDILSFAGVSAGCRAYIAVAGGFEVKTVMRSASTYLRGKLGGYKGRALKAGDVLHIGGTFDSNIPVGFPLPSEYFPDYQDTVRVIMGPQDDAFTQKGIDTFLSAEYTVTNEADRMGCRLDGPEISHKNGADIISDGIALGAIQVPAHGKPIIMLADRQTTGGYTKIANVISVDIPSVAQKKPGDHLTFEKVSIEEAQVLYRKRKQQLEHLKQLIQTTIGEQSGKVTYYVLTVNGQKYEVSIEEVG
jgi:antagonist of KipI